VREDGKNREGQGERINERARRNGERVTRQKEHGRAKEKKKDSSREDGGNSEREGKKKRNTESKISRRYSEIGKRLRGRIDQTGRRRGSSEAGENCGGLKVGDSSGGESGLTISSGGEFLGGGGADKV